MNPWGVDEPVATEAKFFNAARATVFLLVEGGSDLRFWYARIDRRCCQVRALNGRDKVLAELEALSDEQRGCYLAVLDADFDRLEGTLRAMPDVVWTDLHDLECILIASPALDKVLAELGSPDKCDAVEREEKKPVRELLLEHGCWAGRLRWLSRRDGLELKFRKNAGNKGLRHVEYGKFCDKKSWTVNPAELVRTVLNFSERHELGRDGLLEQMQGLPEVDAWQLCVGHDLMGLLCVGLSSRLGSRNLSMEELEERFRLAFETGDLHRTAMYRDMCAWEQAHPRYRIFPQHFVRIESADLAMSP